MCLIKYLCENIFGSVITAQLEPMFALTCEVDSCVTSVEQFCSWPYIETWDYRA